VERDYEQECRDWAEKYERLQQQKLVDFNKEVSNQLLLRAFGRAKDGKVLPETEQKVFHLVKLANEEKKQIYQRDLVRGLKLEPTTIFGAVKRLVAKGLMLKEKKGRKTYLKIIEK